MIADEDTVIVVDVRAFPCPVRRATVFELFERLGPGECFEFVNDHDPAGLKRLLSEHCGEPVGFDYREAGPEAWRVRVTRP